MRIIGILSFVTCVVASYGAAIPKHVQHNPSHSRHNLSQSRHNPSQSRHKFSHAQHNKIKDIVDISDEELSGVDDVDLNNVEGVDEIVYLSEVEEVIEIKDSDVEDITNNNDSDSEVEKVNNTVVKTITTEKVEPTSTIDFPTETATETETIEPTETSIILTPGPVSCTYKKKDEDEKFNENKDNSITCNGKICTVKGNGVTATEGLVTITAAGNYILQGELQGQVLIQADKKDFIHLILNDSSVISNSGPALNIQQAEKVTITLVGHNKLEDSENYVTEEKAPDSCLYAKADLSFNGDGILDVTGNFGTAIHTSKDLKLVTGNINVDAKDKGIKAKNSICIKDANIYVNSINTALKVTRQDDPEKGYIVIDNGNITLSSQNDAIHGETHITINDGFIDIKDCKEGIEAQMIDILGGEIHINSFNDGINASKVGKIKNEDDMMMPPPPPPPMGDPNDPNSFMGPPPPPPEATDGSMYINIVGGKTYITVNGVDIDGIDSNGILYVGGKAELYVNLQYGGIYGNMATLDGDGDNVIHGDATIVTTSRYLGYEEAGEILEKQMEKLGITGPVERPPPPPKSAEEKGKIYQDYINIEIPRQAAKSEIVLRDEKNKVIASYKPLNEYDRILITSPKMKAGMSYTLTAGNFTESYVASKAFEVSFESPSVDGF